ncbi:hypothetical protein Y032_0235g3178 [Ancylostoma ceylanicum]|uniref:Uncharacterized protein n=1 Tax=Ancylostoma ceylanicum TaxID=53326 RepID=A0A016SFM2_9BILA|nr:hypothetical protein Y032_0235g3178 [Ancylostoma ceylanicum]
MRSYEIVREYGEATSAAKKTVSAAKVACYKHMYDELDTVDREKNIPRIAKARQRATEDLGHVMQIRDNNGRLLHHLPDILNWLLEHYSVMCNEGFPHPSIPSAISVLGPAPPFQED